MATKCQQARLFLDYLRYGKNVQRSCSSIAIEQGLQAALNHSRPSAVLRRHRGLISAQHGQVFIGFSFIGSSVNDCGGRVNDGTSCGDSKENARCLANAENGYKGDKKDGGNDEDGLHGVLVLEAPAILAFVKLGSVEITAFLLSAVLSVTRDGFG